MEIMAMRVYKGLNDIILLTRNNTDDKKIIEILNKANKTVSEMLKELKKQQEILKSIDIDLVKGS